MTHGAKGWHRRGGAIGQRLFPGTVMRGMKTPGHMGQVQRTTQNLEVVQVRPEDNVILVKGAIPGSKGDYVVIRESKKLRKGSAKAEAARANKAATVSTITIDTRLTSAGQSAVNSKARKPASVPPMCLANNPARTTVAILSASTIKRPSTMISVGETKS